MSHPANQFLLQADFIQWQTRLKSLSAIVCSPSRMIPNGIDRADPNRMMLCATSPELSVDAFATG
jgi:hypothetical protein